MADKQIMTPRKQILKRSRMTKEEVVVVHSCTQTVTLSHLEKNIQKLSEIITGNGHPEDGICRKVALIGERQGAMVDKLTDIHKSLADYHTETKEAKKEALDAREKAMTVHSALMQYQASIAGEEKGADKASTKGQVNFNNLISIIGTILVIIGLIITVITTRRADEVLQDKINDLGTPVIVNPRGVPQQLPVGDSLKFFRDGEFKSTIRDSQ